MIIRRLFPSLILLLCFSCSFAQREANIWYFGDGAGLDFNSGTPVALTDGQITSDAAGATISDKNGNLLFYTDGKTVWNALHDTMSNGTGLMGDATYVSSVIAQLPGSDSLYYIFTIDGPFFSSVDSLTLRYSIVNKSLDGGNGDVVFGFKNVPVFNHATEKLTAIRHSNGCDVWIITHEWGNNSFYAYLLTSAGISAPVISKSGSSHSGNIGNALGEMKASPDGKKIALALGFDKIVEIFDFDCTSGKVANPLTISIQNSFAVFSVSFAPNNSLLYVTGGTITDSIFQFDLSLGDSSSIQASKIGISQKKWISSIQLAPDEKIYLARNNKDSLGVINNPNGLGINADFTENGFSLGGKICKQGLPNFIQTIFNPTKPGFTSVSDTVCVGTPIPFTGIHPYNVLSWLWNFDDTASPNNTDTAQNPVHIFSDTGVYNVRLIITGYCREDTVVKTIVVEPNTMSVNLGNDTTTCYGMPVTLDAQNPGSSYTWSTGDTTQTVTVNSAATYYVTVSQQGCSVSDTLTISQLPEIVIGLGNDTVNCAQDSIFLDAGTSGDTYFWSTGDTTQTIYVNSTGAYSVSVFSSGCFNSDTVSIVQSQLSVTVLSTDTVINLGGSVALSAIVAGGSTYSWSPANAGLSCTNCLNPLASPEEAVTYTITAADTNGCTVTDAVAIEVDASSVIFVPDIFSPNGDGNNDVLYVRGKNIESINFAVYDRWGEKVFETTDINMGWDGTFRGKPMNPAVLVYYATGSFTDGSKINEKGHVALVR